MDVEHREIHVFQNYVFECSCFMYLTIQIVNKYNTFI